MEVSATKKQQLHLLKDFSVLLKSVFLCTNYDIVNQPPTMIWGVNFNNQNYYFITKSACKLFIKDNNMSRKNIFTLEYMTDYAGRDEVIRYISGDTVILYNAINHKLYETFDFKKSIERGYPCWNMYCGTIKDKYDIFEEYGIVFQNEAYKEKTKILVNN